MTAGSDRWWSPWRDAGGCRIVYVDLRPDPDREARATALRDTDVRRRWEQLRADRPGRQFALCRAALRIELAERLGCRNRDLSFAAREHGKPFALLEGSPAKVGFNVSHSGDHGLIAFAGRDGVGVDLEVRRPRRDFTGIGRRVYGPAERRALAAAAGTGEEQRLFYRLWSLKEALIKAIGTGFSRSPADFEIPAAMLRGERAAAFRFPHRPNESFWLEDLGEIRFAAALACRLPDRDTRSGAS